MDEGTTVTLTFTGDIMFDGALTPPRLLFHQAEVVACNLGYRDSLPLPFLNNEPTRRWLVEQGCRMSGVEHTSHCAQSVPIEGAGDPTRPFAPFEHVTGERQVSDLIVVNLECPLSWRGRRMKSDNCYRASPAFGESLKTAGVSVASFSNNHCMDYGEEAFLDTIATLETHGIPVVGAVMRGDDSRRTVITERNGIRIAFLAYNLVGPDYVYAWETESGVIPLNELSVTEDLQRVRSLVDWVVASVHWGLENVVSPLPQQIWLAHRMVDLGVDVVVGHHSHVPGPVEIYKDRAILYSLGNFIFGHTHTSWEDSMMIRVQLSKTRTEEITVIPLSTTGPNQYKPCPIQGERAEAMLNVVRRASACYGVQIPDLDGRIRRANGWSI